MSLKNVAYAGLFLLLGGCGYPQDQFIEDCRKTANIDVLNQALWRDYLVERRQELQKSKVTVNGKEVDATALYPLVFTNRYRYTNDFAEGEIPESTRKPYRNDFYIIHKATGKKVARFRNLSVTISEPGMGSAMYYNCTSFMSNLYTGIELPFGSVSVTSREGSPQ